MKKAIIVLICFLFSFSLGQAGAQENHSTVNYSIYTGKPGDLVPPGFSCGSMGPGTPNVECDEPINSKTRIKVKIYVFTSSKTTESSLRSKAYEMTCSHIEYPQYVRGTILSDTCSKDRFKAVKDGLEIDPGSYNEFVTAENNFTNMWVQAGNVSFLLSTDGNAKAIIQSFLSRIPTKLEQQPTANAVDASRIGAIDTVKGAPKVIRGGVETTLRTGDSLRIGDKIITGDHEKVKIEFADGDFRVVTQNSSIEFQEGDKNLNLTAIQKIFGTLETVLYPDNPNGPQNTIVFGIKLDMTSDKSAVTSAGTNNGILHVQHSRVRYDFSTAEDRVTVFEGRVESIDPRTRERMTTITGQQFTMKAGRPLREAIITYVRGAANQPGSRASLQSKAE